MEPSTTLPAVKNSAARGHSSDVYNSLQMSASKNSAKLAEMRNVAMLAANFEEEQGQPLLGLANNQRYIAQFRNSRQRGQSFTQTLAQPSNYELAAIRSGFDPLHDATIKDF